MAYRIGIDVGAADTAWATVSRTSGRAEQVDGGTVRSVAGLFGGRLVVGAEVTDPAGLQEVAPGFVDRLGQSEAIVLGGTPYGAETLVGRLIASVVRVASERLGEVPGAVVLVHDDGLDEFRVGLLTEAARVAGVPLADIVTVSRSEALGAAASASVGAATLGWLRRPAPEPHSAAGVGAAELGIAAGGAVAGAAGAAAVAAGGLGEGVATASAAMPAPAGPAGTPLTPPTVAGPAGTPLTPPAAAPGTPLTPPAAAPGTPITPAAGPAGSPLPGPVAGAEGTPLAPTTSSVASGVGHALKPRRLPIMIGAGVAAVAVVAVVVVVAMKDDPPPATLGASATSDSVLTSEVAAGDTTVVATTVPVVAGASRCVQGRWTMRNDSFADFVSGQFAAAGGAVAAAGVSGSVSIDVAEDGTWTMTYEGWTLDATMPASGMQMSVTIDGVDVSTGTFDDDGTFSFSGVSVGTTMTETATINGAAVPIPPIDRQSQMVGGTGTYTCEGDVLTVTGTGAPASFIMDRVG